MIKVEAVIEFDVNIKSLLTQHNMGPEGIINPENKIRLEGLLEDSIGMSLNFFDPDIVNVRIKINDKVIDE